MKQLWGAKGLLLLEPLLGKSNIGEQLAFIQLRESSRAIDDIDQTGSFISGLWILGVKMDYMLNHLAFARKAKSMNIESGLWCEAV